MGSLYRRGLDRLRSVLARPGDLGAATAAGNRALVARECGAGQRRGQGALSSGSATVARAVRTAGRRAERQPFGSRVSYVRGTRSRGLGRAGRDGARWWGRRLGARVDGDRFDRAGSAHLETGLPNSRGARGKPRVARWIRGRCRRSPVAWAAEESLRAMEAAPNQRDYGRSHGGLARVWNSP